MTEHQKRINQFMRLAGQDVPSNPTEPSIPVRLLRAKLILEEALETIFLGLGVKLECKCPFPNDINDFYLSPAGTFDMIQCVDGCCDLSVVTIGTLSACGIEDELLLAEVDNNNLAKFNPGSYRDSDGKWIKPPDHKPPQIEKIIGQISTNESK